MSENLNNNTIASSEVIKPIISDKLTCFDDVNNKKIYNCSYNEDGSISGYDEEGTRAKYSIRFNCWLYGQEIRKDNLITFADRTPEQLKELQSKSLIVRKENQEKKKNINEIAKLMLEKTLSDKAIDTVLGEGVEMLEDKSIASVMVAKMIQTALAGSFKAFETVRDTAGYKPRNEIEINGEIMTDSDRALIDKLTARTSKTG